VAEENLERSLTLAEPGRPAQWMAPPAAEPDGEEPKLPLSHYLWLLKRHRWKILFFVTLSVLATLIISTRLTPMYESTSTIDIDRRMPTGVVGQEAMQSSLQDSDQFLATQLKLIHSDSVLRPVVQKFRLQAFERDPLEESRARPVNSAEAPVRLTGLRVARPPNTYLVQISYRSPDPRLAAEVANAIAQSYLEHTYNIRYRASAGLASFMEKQIEELRAKMERSSGALAQFERELNLVNPEEKTTIVSARLQQLNTEYTNAQAERVRKEATHSSVRGGSIEAAQVSTQGDCLRRLSERLNEAQEKFVQVKALYGANHPEYRKAAMHHSEVQRQLQEATANIGRRVEVEYREALHREAMLQKSVIESKGELDRLNARSFEYQSMKREAEADKKLYEELVRKIREAGINAGFQNSSIRIADPARPALGPVSPNIRLNVLLAFLFSALLAMGAAVLSDLLDNTIRDPEQVPRLLRTDVIGSLPVVKSWRDRLLPVASNGKGGELVKSGGAAQRALTSYDEAIRTIRNSILLTDFDRRLRSVMITSATPGEGKSTIAAHLAVTHAEQRHRTLLVDGDLRRPSVHRRFTLPKGLGLSNVLLEQADWRQALLHMESIPDLDILIAGPASRRAADFIGKGLQPILEEATKEYDLVVLDSPPLLGFPEPLQMASFVDGVVVVALAGQTNRKAVASVIKTLGRLRTNVLGLVLNEVHKDVSDTYYYYGYYGKYHKYYHAAAE